MSRFPQLGQQHCHKKGHHYHRNKCSDGELQCGPQRVHQGEASVSLGEYVYVVLKSYKAVVPADGLPVGEAGEESADDWIECEHCEEDEARDGK